MEIGEPIRVHIEFQNVSDRLLRVLKEASVETCLPTLYTSEGGTDSYPLEPRSERAIALQETVLLEPGKTHRLNWNAFPTFRKAAGPAKLAMSYRSPKNTNVEVSHFWSGYLERVTLNLELVQAGEKTIQARVAAAQAQLAKLWPLLEAHRKANNEYPQNLQDFLKGENAGLIVCPPTGRGFGYTREPREGDPIVYSGEFTQGGKVRQVELSPTGQVSVRDLRDAPVVTTPTPRPRAAELDANAMGDLWATMGAADSNAAREAAATLAAGGAKAVQFLERQLDDSLSAAETRRIEGLIGSLAADVFRQREQATAELERSGVAATRRLKQALPKAEEEARLRIACLLESHGRRAPWGIVALALIEDAQALSVLEKATKGDTDVAVYARFVQGLLTDPGSLKAIRKFGVNRGDRLGAGFLFVGGQYVDAPYVVERWGLDVYINGRLFRRGRDSEVVLGPSEGEHNKEYAEKRLSGPSVWFLNPGAGEMIVAGQKGEELLRSKLAAYDAGPEPATSRPGLSREEEANLEKIEGPTRGFRPTPQLYERLGMPPPAAKSGAATRPANRGPTSARGGPAVPPNLSAP